MKGKVLTHELLPHKYWLGLPLFLCSRCKVVPGGCGLLMVRFCFFPLGGLRVAVPLGAIVRPFSHVWAVLDAHQKHKEPETIHSLCF